MERLPENWKWSSVGDLSQLHRGITYQKNQAENNETKNNCLVLRGGNIQEGNIYIGDDVVYVPRELVKEDQYLREGDIVIVGSTGSKDLIGKAALSHKNESKISFGSFLMLIRPAEGINKKYFGYFFLSEQYRNSIRESSGGVNINNIRREHITSIPFPLPPLPEQKRIVAKLDSLFGHLDQLKARLSTIPILLKQFRQAVLTQAVTGKLTEEWRTKNLLIDKVILKELTKKSRHDVQEIKADEILVEIPETWLWSRLGSVAELINGDRGKNYPNVKEYVKNGIPFINTGHIELDGKLSIEYMNYISREKFNSLGGGKIVKDDLVYCLRGATIGKTAFVNQFSEGAIASSLVIIRYSQQVVTKYGYYFLISSLGKDLINRFLNGTAQPNLAASSVKNYTFPLPPIEEQLEIVRRAESLFAVADRIEASYNTLQEKIDHLPQAILAKAFRGELVKSNAGEAVLVQDQ